MNAIIYIIKDQLHRNPKQRSFIVELGVIKKLAGIRGTDNNQLKSALRSLATTAIEYNILWKDKEARWIFSFLSHAHIQIEQRGKSSFIVIECPSIVIEAIRDPGMYARLNLTITRGFVSKYWLIFYETMVDYIWLNKIRIHYDDLRKLFGLSEEKYKWSFSMFEKRVLRTAINEINQKSEIHVDIVCIERIWRRVVSVTFSAYYTKAMNSLNSEHDDILRKLRSFWFSDKRASQIVNSHDQEYILANIAAVEEQYIRKGKTIKSKPALLTAAFKSDYRIGMNAGLIPWTNGVTWVAERVDSETLQLEVVEKAKNEEFEKLKSTLSDEELNRYELDFVNQLWESHIATKVINKHWINHPIVQWIFDKYLMEILLPW